MSSIQTTWTKEPLIWREGTTEYISVVFTWQLEKIVARCLQQDLNIKKYVVGGPATKIRPDLVSGLGKDVAVVDNLPGMLQKHNLFATKTSQGCPRNCDFCWVQKIHPEFQEIRDFVVNPIVCDDNLLACSRKHFDRVIDKLKAANFNWYDFNQGLDARLLTQYHANRFAELNNPKIRLAWDRITGEKNIISAITKLRKAKIPRKNIACYVLIGYFDSPDDALYRLETLWHGFGIQPNPMRYQSNATRKNEYVSPHWTHKELDRYVSYWFNLRHTAGVPFSEYQHRPGINKKTEDI